MLADDTGLVEDSEENFCRLVSGRLWDGFKLPVNMDKSKVRDVRGTLLWVE